MKRRWQAGVLNEVADAILYLEEERPSLGLAFRASLDRTLVDLEEFPLGAPVVHRNTRRVQASCDLSGGCSQIGVLHTSRSGEGRPGQGVGHGALLRRTSIRARWRRDSRWPPGAPDSR